MHIGPASYPGRLRATARSTGRLSVTCLLILLPLALGACSAGGAGIGGSSAESQMAFGVEMARRDLWSEALFRFQQAAQLEPNNPRIYNNLAVACEATGRFDEALEYYRKAVQLDPGNRDLKKNYARFAEFYQGFQSGDAAAATPPETKP